MSTELYVGCMPFGFKKQELSALFEPYKDVTDVQLFEDLENATFDAYAYVTLASDDAQRAVQELDGRHIRGRVLRVNVRVTREDNLQTP